MSNSKTTIKMTHLSIKDCVNICSSPISYFYSNINDNDFDDVIKGPTKTFILYF